MVDLLKIVGYSMAVVLLGSLWAPGLYGLGQWAMSQGWFAGLRPFGFDKYVNRAVIATAVLGLWPLMRWLRVRRWRDLGLMPNRHGPQHAATGALLGAGGLGWVAACLVHFDYLHVDRAWTIGDWLGALVAAVAVGLLEESFFRGAIFGVLRRRLPVGVAAVAMSLFFACLHFVRSNPAPGKIDHPHIWSGLRLLPSLLWQFGRVDLMVDTWLTLFVMSCLLAYTVWRTKSLALSFGLHAGWVFALKLVTAVTRPGEPSVWVGRELRSGLAPLALMIVTWGLVGLGLRAADAWHRSVLADAAVRADPPNASSRAGRA